jgi:hypothetical protein
MYPLIEGLLEQHDEFVAMAGNTFLNPGAG